MACVFKHDAYFPEITSIQLTNLPTKKYHYTTTNSYKISLIYALRIFLHLAFLKSPTGATQTPPPQLEELNLLKGESLRLGFHRPNFSLTSFNSRTN
mmetsp:Transcript_16646/g.20357  ORF Transcript_16646/g.20357 Transcript_16646/m.20357 type:complete len:97 (-) Transcript_16646:1668-1958(-)